MVDMITAACLNLLRVVDKNPDLNRDKLLTVKGVQKGDLDYLVHHDLIREQRPGCFRVTHLGQLALKRM